MIIEGRTTRPSFCPTNKMSYNIYCKYNFTDQYIIDIFFSLEPICLFTFYSDKLREIHWSIMKIRYNSYSKIVAIWQIFLTSRRNAILVGTQWWDLLSPIKASLCQPNTVGGIAVCLCGSWGDEGKKRFCGVVLWQTIFSCICVSRK